MTFFPSSRGSLWTHKHACTTKKTHLAHAHKHLLLRHLYMLAVAVLCICGGGAGYGWFESESPRPITWGTEEWQCKPGRHTKHSNGMSIGPASMNKQPCGAQGTGAGICVCVHHLDYLTWCSSITCSTEYTWDPNTPMANSSSSNPAGIWSDPLQYSHTLILLPLFTSRDWNLFSLSLSLLMPFLI